MDIILNRAEAEKHTGMILTNLQQTFDETKVFQMKQ